MSSPETLTKNEPLPFCKTEVAPENREAFDPSLIQVDCSTSSTSNAIPAADFQRKVYITAPAATRLNFFNEIQAFDRFMEETPLSSSAIALWFALIRTSNRFGWKNPFSVSLSVLIQRSGISRRNLYKVRETLRDLHLIDYREREGHLSSEYTLYSLADRYPALTGCSGNTDTACASPCTETVAGMVECAVVGTKPDTVTDTMMGTATGTVADTVVDPIIKQDNTKKKPDKKKHALVNEERFTRFWESYPRKEGKETARREWIKLKPDDDLADEIVLSVVRKAATPEWLRENGRYVPGPSRYLRDRRWEDEPPTQQNAFVQAMTSIQEVIPYVG